MITLFTALSIEFELLERVKPMSTFIMLIILCSFLLVAWSGRQINGYFQLLFKNFFRFVPKEKEFKESIGFSLGSNFLLFLNFFISLSLCLFLFTKGFIATDESIFLSLIFSTLFILIVQFGFRFIGYVSGETSIIESSSQINKNTFQLGGIFLLVLATVWILNEKNSIVFSYLFVGFMIFILLMRVIKGILLVLKRRIKWYYFILYLCALEILPAIAFSKLLMDFFK